MSKEANGDESVVHYVEDVECYRIFRFGNSLNLGVIPTNGGHVDNDSTQAGRIFLIENSSSDRQLTIIASDTAYTQPGSRILNKVREEDETEQSIKDWSIEVEKLINYFSLQQVSSNWIFPYHGQLPAERPLKEIREEGVRGLIEEKKFLWKIDGGIANHIELDADGDPISSAEDLEYEPEELEKSWRKEAENEWDKLNLNSEGQYEGACSQTELEHMYRTPIAEECKMLRWLVESLMEPNKDIRNKRLERLKMLLNVLHLEDREKNYTPLFLQALEASCKFTTLDSPSPPLKIEVRKKFHDLVTPRLSKEQANDAFKDALKNCGFMWLP